MKKRVLALLVVCILALSMPARICAAESTRILAVYQMPDINVQVNGAGSVGDVIINPYRLPIAVDGVVKSAEEIYNKPWSVVNKSDVAVRVDAKVSATVAKGSSIELATKSVRSDRSGYKMLFLFLDSKVVDPDTQVSELNWDETVFSSKKHVVITEFEDERENLMSLAASGKEGSVGAFHIAGNAARKPDEAWDSEVDRVSVNVFFTFSPTALK